jgi:hypothetical protein
MPCVKSNKRFYILLVNFKITNLIVATRVRVVRHRTADVKVFELNGRWLSMLQAQNLAIRIPDKLLCKIRSIKIFSLAHFKL